MPDFWFGSINYLGPKVVVLSSPSPHLIFRGSWGESVFLSGCWGPTSTCAGTSGSRLVLLFVLELHQASRMDRSTWTLKMSWPSSQPHSSDKWVGLESGDPQTYLNDFTQISRAISWASSEQLRKGHRPATQAWPTEPTPLPHTTATNTTWTTWTSCPWMRRS